MFSAPESEGSFFFGYRLDTTFRGPKHVKHVRSHWDFGTLGHLLFWPPRNELIWTRMHRTVGVTRLDADEIVRISFWGSVPDVSSKARVRLRCESGHLTRVI